MSEHLPAEPNPNLEPGHGGIESIESEQEAVFGGGRDALDRREMDGYFQHLDRTMIGMGGPDARAWQQLAVDLYAAGVTELGRAEMARLWDQRTQDPDTREWLFDHLGRNSG